MKTITININECLISVPPDKTFAWGLTITENDKIVKTDFYENIFDLIPKIFDFINYNEEIEYKFNVNISKHEENLTEEIIYFNILYYIYNHYKNNSLIYKQGINNNKNINIKTYYSYYIVEDIFYYVTLEYEYFMTFPNTDCCKDFVNKFKELILKCKNMI